MASRPQNIGIKAIEIYFPSQVRASLLLAVIMTVLAPLSDTGAIHLCAADTITTTQFGMVSL